MEAAERWLRCKASAVPAVAKGTRGKPFPGRRAVGPAGDEYALPASYRWGAAPGAQGRLSPIHFGYKLLSQKC